MSVANIKGTKTREEPFK